jgi:hypothetical protein
MDILHGWFGEAGGHQIYLLIKQYKEAQRMDDGEEIVVSKGEKYLEQTIEVSGRDVKVSINGRWEAPNMVELPEEYLFYLAVGEFGHGQLAY